ncbi:hypothetical protein [Actinomyces oricola]|uniref:hypothetical protein n=1 Tax=Actinomyces oricola TaxID=206043 RepID=UPI0013E8EF9C|nr:hypothetical protein [Actinomyces oricola]
MPTKFPRRTAVIVMAALPAVLALSACGSSSPMDQYAGTYTGSSGRTTLLLNKDGSAFYSESRTAKYEPDKRGSAKWKIEKNRLIVYDNEALGYDIYAELRGNEKGNEDSLLFQSNNNRWNDEVYTRGSKSGLGGTVGQCRRSRVRKTVGLSAAAQPLLDLSGIVSIKSW